MTETLDFSASTGEGDLPRIGMAPLVDIVLLLICFYLLVMRSIQSHTDDYVQLPEVQGQHLAELVPAELTINVRLDGDMSLNGIPVDLESLRAALGAEQASALASGTTLRVVVRADGRERYEALDQVLGACRDVGLSSITLRTREGRDP